MNMIHLTTLEGQHIWFNTDQITVIGLMEAKNDSQGKFHPQGSVIVTPAGPWCVQQTPSIIHASIPNLRVCETGRD